jgi:hypothetical protein
MRQNSRYIAILLATFTLLSGTPIAAQADQLYFAGISFLSDYSQVPARFPNTTKLLGFERGQASPEIVKLNEALLSAVGQQKPSSLYLITGDSNLGSGNTKVLSLAIADESTETQMLDNDYIAIYTISAQVLIFDFAPENKRLVAAWPFVVRYSELITSPPTADQELSAFRHLVLGDDQKASTLTKAWALAMSRVSLSKTFRLVKIAEIAVEPKAEAALPTGQERDIVTREIAQYLEGTVSSKWHVPMVPFTAGSAIGSTMRGVFADGKEYELILPEPDYLIKIKLREFRKMTVMAGGGEVAGYGAFITVKAESASLGSVLLEGKFKNVASVTLPKSATIRLQDWPQFKSALLGLFDRFADQALKPDRAWLAQSSSTPNVAEQLATMTTRMAITN